MNAPSPSNVQRARKTRRGGSAPRGYKCTWELLDEPSQVVLAATDLVGAALHSTIAFTDSAREVWLMAPNRKLMPSSWTMKDPSGRFVAKFDQQILGKLTNPLYRTMLTLRDEDGKELHRVIDPRTNVPDRVFGLGPDEWAILRGEQPVGKLVWLSRRKTGSDRGALGWLRNWLSGSDWGIASVGSERELFPAPVSLALIILCEELSNRSGA